MATGFALEAGETALGLSAFEELLALPFDPAGVPKTALTHLLSLGKEGVHVQIDQLVKDALFGPMAKVFGLLCWGMWRQAWRVHAPGHCKVGASVSFSCSSRNLI